MNYNSTVITNDKIHLLLKYLIFNSIFIFTFGTNTTFVTVHPLMSFMNLRSYRFKKQTEWVTLNTELKDEKKQRLLLKTFYPSFPFVGDLLQY